MDAGRMVNTDAYLQAINEAYPGLPITSAELNAEGQNSDVVVVNGELVFRFPKYPHVLEQLRAETAILRGIEGRLPLAVPAPIYGNLEQRAVGQAFVGYRMIRGEPLWRDTFRKLDRQDLMPRLAGQVAGFLSALHSVPVQKLPVRQLPLYDTYEESADIYARIQQRLFGHMRPDARAWAAQHFEGFLGDSRNFQYDPVLKHGDFGPSNILFDGERQRIAGVIDFGSSGLGDPAYDFAGLLSGYGEEFVQQCLGAYPAEPGLMGRIRFYQGTFALLEALFKIENGDEEALRAGLERYV